MKILIEAPILTESGYGQHSRLVYESLQGRGFDIYVGALGWGNTSWNFENFKQYGELKNDMLKFSQVIESAKSQNKDPQFDIQIHVGIANEFKKKAKYSVLVTAGIETDRVSSDWLIRTYQGIDKIIVPSEHSQKGFLETSYEARNNNTGQNTIIGCNCPVDVVPYPVRHADSVDLNLDLETDFNFLTVALLGPRKNIENSIVWFLQEFKDDPNVGLILKTARSKHSVMDRNITEEYIKSITDKYTDSKCKVYLVHGAMTQDEIHALYLHPKVKAYLSTTHGEGYGLPIFEAAYSGLPVIATDWSAHLDFLSAPYKEGGKIKDKKLFARVDYNLGPIPQHVVWKDILVEGSQWAYPTEVSVKVKMRKVYENHGMYSKWATALKTKVLETHSEDRVREKMYSALLPELMRNALNPKQVDDEIDQMFASLSDQ